MPEPSPRSALAARTTGATDLGAGLSCREAPFADLALLTAWPGTQEAFFARVSDVLEMPVPADFRRVTTAGTRVAFRLTPRRLMVLDESAPLTPLAALMRDEDGAVSMQGHARVRLRIEGANAAALLARGIAVDLHPDVFGPGEFIQTCVHDIAVTVHRPGEGAVHDVLVPRSFALSFHDWLTRAAGIAAHAIV